MATEEAFRRDYGRLAELRSLFHRDVPFYCSHSYSNGGNKENY